MRLRVSPEVWRSREPLLPPVYLVLPRWDLCYLMSSVTVLQTCDCLVHEHTSFKQHVARIHKRSIKSLLQYCPRFTLVSSPVQLHSWFILITFLSRFSSVTWFNQRCHGSPELLWLAFRNIRGRRPRDIDDTPKKTIKCSFKWNRNCYFNIDDAKNHQMFLQMKLKLLF